MTDKQVLCADVHPDTIRLDWVLSFATGDSATLADRRTMLLVNQILEGRTGRAAVDAAMAKEARK